MIHFFSLRPRERASLKPPIGNPRLERHFARQAGLRLLRGLLDLNAFKLWTGLTAATLLIPTFAQAEQCLVRTTSLNFGVYDVSRAVPVDSSASIVFSCTGGSSFNVDVALSESGSVSSRVLYGTGYGAKLAFNLYKDAARVQPLTGWVIPASATETTYTLYGRIRGGQDVPAGAYSESLALTVLP